MDREELFKWLNNCTSHEWEVVREDYGYVTVVFLVSEEEEDDPE